jgi:hypothetical protein
LGTLSDLSELFKVVAEGKKDYEKNDLIGQKIKEVKDIVKVDLSSLFEELAGLNKELGQLESLQEETLIEAVPEIPAQPIIKTPEERKSEADAVVAKYLKGKSFQQPEPDLVSKNIDDIRGKIKFLEQAIGRIAATGPGGGEVRLEFLDDVDRPSAKVEGKYLKYDSTTNKWIGDTIETGDVVYNTTLVETDSYTVQDGDWYIGVNYAGTVTITLPTTANAGRVLVIKDESGNCSTNPINATGTVDNDAGGFSLQVDNGGIQMVYRAGWRII